MQRHTVTELRQDWNVTKEGGITVGDRIKDRLRELGKDVKWLHHKTGIPVSTLYEIMNGRMKSTTRLPTIAAALGLRPLWLETKDGPRLIADAEHSVKPDVMWPFSPEVIPSERWNRLTARQQQKIEEMVVGMLEAYEAGRTSPPPKSGPGNRHGQRRAAG